MFGVLFNYLIFSNTELSQTKRKERRGEGGKGGWRKTEGEGRKREENLKEKNIQINEITILHIYLSYLHSLLLCIISCLEASSTADRNT